jgi:hypothetical protein
MAGLRVASDGGTMTVRVPISIRRSGGRRLILAPDGTKIGARSVCRGIDSAVVKAVARAFHWREMLENGTSATIAEIAAAERMNASYVGRVLRLTLLAPKTIEDLLDGKQPAEVTLAMLMQPFPADWERQRFVGKNLPPESTSQGHLTSGLGAKADIDGHWLNRRD